LIAISQRTRADLITRLGAPDGKIRVIHNAIAERFAPLADETARAEARRRLDLPERYFLYVGALERRKNVTGLLRAFAKFSRANGDGWRLLLAGPEGLGADEARLLHRQLGLNDQARFLGYVPSEDLPAIYALARALVFPSVFEGFGLPPVEAMACGTPAVVADNSALGEIVGDAALKAPHDNADALAARLGELAADDRLWADRSAAGRVRAQRYNLSDFARRTLAVYREAAEERRA
jgi:glycosyltransferase involved in cell wall biosynthesis